MTTYVMNGKRYTQEECDKYYENKKRKQYEKLSSIVYQKEYSDVVNFEEITKKEFYEKVKTTFDVDFLTDVLDIGYGDKGYKTIYRITVMFCNLSCTSYPGMDTSYSEGVFKYDGGYYLVAFEGSN